MNRPLDVQEGIMFANSLIIGSEFEEKVREFKMQREFFTDKDDDETISKTMLLGRSYWRGFLKRHQEQIESATGSPLIETRCKWSSFANFDIMYTLCYQSLEEAGVAVKLDSLIHYDEHGIECTEENAFGEPCYHQLIHPDYVLFFDECGTNLKGDKNGSYGGQKFIKKSGAQKAYSKVNSQDCRYTTLGFTAATGDPVLCVIIIQVPSLVHGEIHGTDIRLLHNSDKPLTNLADLQSHTGSSKLYPKRPVCTFRGKVIPAMVCCSEGGGINSKILTDCFKYLDHLEVFDRSVATPACIFDGHHSRFSLEFIQYINSEETLWKGNIGCPYATYFWQVS